MSRPSERGRHLQDLRSAAADVGLGGERAGPADVALRRPRGEVRHRLVDAGRRRSIVATASYGGVRRVTTRHRDRTVTGTSSTVGAHSIHTVRGAGSSSAFSSASAARLGEPVGVGDDQRLPRAPARDSSPP